MKTTLMRFVLAALALPLAVFVPMARGELPVANEKEALPVTIHPEAGELVRSAAADFARIVGAMTGRTPEVRESADPQGIVIGTTAQFGVYKDDAALAFHGPFDGREAFIVRPDEEKRRLWILGNREDGASHGVYTILRENGYRALYPGKNWEVIPHRAALAVAGPSQGRPKVLTRSIWAGFGTFDKEQGRDIDLWRRRNRLGASITGAIGHSWESMIRTGQERIAANPRILGEKEDGSVNPNSLRHGTMDAVDFTVEHFKRALERPNAQDILSLAPTDGDNYSRDKETAARGPVNESFYWYVNEVAKQAAQFAPEKLVGTTAYYRHAKPPGFNLEPNVIVLGATMFGSGGMSLEDFFAAWSKRSRYIGIRDYLFSGYQTFADHPDGGYARAHLERQARWLRDYPIAYYSAEGLWEWGVRGTAYYALAQLLWDPTQEVSAILDDFSRSAYGPAADAMNRYAEDMEPTGRKVHKYRIGRAVRHLREAAQKAKGEAAVTARLDDLKLYLVHAALLDKMRSLKKDDPERFRLVAQDLEWNYRARRGYILNYNCNRRFWMVNKTLLGNAFERERSPFDPRGSIYWLPDHERPSSAAEQEAAIAEALGEAWGLNGGFIVPRGAAAELPPPDAAEIARRFEEIVVPFYPEIEVEEVAYSTEYVPVDTGLKREIPAREALWFGASARFLVWRPGASEAAWRVTPNQRAKGKGGPLPLEIRVEQADGTEDEPLSLAQDSLPKPVRLKLGEGLSTVTINSRRKGFLLEGNDREYTALPTDSNTILFVGSGPRDAGHVNAPLYFYVPKGIKEIQIYNDFPKRLVKQSVFRPFGGENVEPELKGELIHLPVAKDQSGRVWEVAEGGVGVRFYFLNLPNILSLDPGKMLIPADVAAKDGLKTVAY